jgi:hypothetical protein
MSAPPITEIAIGTRCTDSARRRAVTTTSPGVGVAVSCSVAAGAASWGSAGRFGSGDAAATWPARRKASVSDMGTPWFYLSGKLHHLGG